MTTVKYRRRGPRRVPFAAFFESTISLPLDDRLMSIGFRLGLEERERGALLEQLALIAEWVLDQRELGRSIEAHAGGSKVAVFDAKKLRRGWRRPATNSDSDARPPARLKPAKLDTDARAHARLQESKRG